MSYSSRQSLLAGVVTALLAGIAGVVGSYAAAGYTQSFVATPVTSFVTQNAPGVLLQFAIGPLTALGNQFGIGHLGQQANLLFAVGLVAVLFACLAFVALVTGRRVGGANGRVVAAGLAGVLVWVPTAVLTGAPATALGAGLGTAIVVGVAAVAVAAGETDGAVSGGRREVLGSFASAFGVGVVGYLLGSRATDTTESTSLEGLGGSNGSDAGGANGSAAGTSGAGTGGTNGTGDAGGTNGSKAADRGGANAKSISRQLAEAKRNSLDVEGLDGLVSDGFYQVDIDNVNPSVNEDDWSLSVTGAVGSEETFDYDDIIGMESVDRFSTLRCVSDPLNGGEMDTALWTGVPMKRVLDGVDPKGTFVLLHAADNYTEEFPVSALRTGFLAYGMNGNVLPEKHGYPVRALIPGHFGEINVKWLTGIEIIDHPAKGFWEKKGWHGTGPVNTVAKLHATNHLDNGKIQVGGHAYAGTRGIERVEVSTDGGDSWTNAELSPVPKPDLAGDVWRQWAYTYEPPGGKHEVVVRAVDGTGTTQPKKETSPYPSGATGWVSKTIGG